MLRVWQAAVCYALWALMTMAWFKLVLMNVDIAILDGPTLKVESSFTYREFLYFVTLPLTVLALFAPLTFTWFNQRNNDNAN